MSEVFLAAIFGVLLLFFATTHIGRDAPSATVVTNCVEKVAEAVATPTFGQVRRMLTVEQFNEWAKAHGMEGVQ